jgi:hypothetical protein
VKTKATAAFVLVCGVGVSFADFQYSQTTKITGGALVNMTKSLGVFSKSARKIGEPQTSTVMLKNNMLRTDHSDGKIEIIDAEGKRFIYIDSVAKTYSTTTFEEFKASMQKAQERAKEEQAKEISKHPEAANVTVTPKIDMQETGATRTILDLPTKEVKMKIDMQIQATDPKAEQNAQSMTMTVNSDSWIAPSIPGYSEMRDFYLKMAKELDWLPGTMSGMAGMNMNPQMGPAMEEFRKSAVKLQGMPLLQTMSMDMGAAGLQTAQTQQPPPPPPQQTSQPQQDSMPTSVGDAIGKGLGGMFGHKKKQQAQDNSQNPGTSSTPSMPSDPNSLMDMQTEVTSYSSNSLDKSLFDIPAGYTQVQRDPDAMTNPKTTGQKK